MWGEKNNGRKNHSVAANTPLWWSRLKVEWMKCKQDPGVAKKRKSNSVHLWTRPKGKLQKYLVWVSLSSPEVTRTFGYMSQAYWKRVCGLEKDLNLKDYVCQTRLKYISLTVNV